jgi:hypothetical protein
LNPVDHHPKDTVSNSNDTINESNIETKEELKPIVDLESNHISTEINSSSYNHQETVKNPSEEQHSKITSVPDNELNKHDNNEPNNNESNNIQAHSSNESTPTYNQEPINNQSESNQNNDDSSKVQESSIKVTNDESSKETNAFKEIISENRSKDHTSPNQIYTSLQNSETDNVEKVDSNVNILPIDEQSVDSEINNLQKVEEKIENIDSSIHSSKNEEHILHVPIVHYEENKNDSSGKEQINGTNNTSSEEIRNKDQNLVIDNNTTTTNNQETPITEKSHINEGGSDNCEIDKCITTTDQDLINTSPHLEESSYNTNIVQNNSESVHKENITINKDPSNQEEPVPSQINNISSKLNEFEDVKTTESLCVKNESQQINQTNLDEPKVEESYAETIQNHNNNSTTIVTHQTNESNEANIIKIKNNKLEIHNNVVSNLVDNQGHCDSTVPENITNVPTIDNPTNENVEETQIQPSVTENLNNVKVEETHNSVRVPDTQTNLESDINHFQSNVNNEESQIQSNINNQETQSQSYIKVDETQTHNNVKIEENHTNFKVEESRAQSNVKVDETQTQNNVKIYETHTNLRDRKDSSNIDQEAHSEKVIKEESQTQKNIQIEINQDQQNIKGQINHDQNRVQSNANSQRIDTSLENSCQTRENFDIKTSVTEKIRIFEDQVTTIGKSPNTKKPNNIRSSNEKVENQQNTKESVVTLKTESTPRQTTDTTQFNDNCKRQGTIIFILETVSETKDINETVLNQTRDQTTIIVENRNNKEIIKNTSKRSWKWIFLTAGFAIASLIFIKKYLKR